MDLYFKFGFTEIQTTVCIRKTQTCQDASMYSALYSVSSPIEFKESTHSLKHEYLYNQRIKADLLIQCMLYVAVVEYGNGKECLKSVPFSRLK